MRVIIVFLLDCFLVLFLLKHKGVEAFFEQKIKKIKEDFKPEKLNTLNKKSSNGFEFYLFTPY